MAPFKRIELPYERRRPEGGLAAEARRWNARDLNDVSELWCFAGRRLYADEDGSGAAINRRHEHRPELITPCIGSRCMAWRWADTDGQELDNDGELYPSHGYCGLAGKP